MTEERREDYASEEDADFKALSEQAARSAGLIGFSTSRVYIEQVVAEGARQSRALDNIRRKLSKEQISHEQTKGDLNQKIAQLEVENRHLWRQLDEAHQQSAMALVVAWLGSVLIAIGVNILTGDGTKSLGAVVIATGAAMEIVAFFVRRRRSKDAG